MRKTFEEATTSLKGWLANQKEDRVQKTAARVRVVKASDLVKVGGLYRIRDDYEAVWRMEADETDGRRYIVRADGAGDATPERVAVTEDAPTADSAKAAYKVVHAGAVYVAWECESCATPNLTKFGNQYECDECHKRFADVLRTDEQRRVDKQTYTRAEVAEHSPEFAQRMAKAGINLAHKSLLQVWDREAEYQPKTGEPCSCKPGVARDNCPTCEGTGKKIDFVKIRSKGKEAAKAVNPWAVCHESVGPEKSDKFERCVKDVKKKSPIKKD
jgi:uncharacterized Zn finger protein (UPF0148 family)